LTVMTRSRQGTGLAAVVVGRSAPGAVVDLAEKVWVGATTPVLGVEEAVAWHSKRLAGLGLGPPSRLAEAAVAVGAPAAVELALPAGCSRLEVVGAVPLGHFTAQLWHPDGQLIDADRGGQSATLFSCGGGKVSVEVTALEHAGEVVLLSLNDPQPPPAAQDHPRAASRLLRRLEAVRGEAQPRDLKNAEAIALAAAGRMVRELEAPAGQCVELLAALEGQAEGIELRTTAGTTSLRSHGRHSVSDRVCAGAEAQPVRAELALETGSATLLWLPL
jgi:hypothetical protein